MEDGLVQGKSRTETEHTARLNPCCNGRWSRTGIFVRQPLEHGIVLILVVMEDGLVQL